MTHEVLTLAALLVDILCMSLLTFTAPSAETEETMIG